jgi:L-threonylcarbamoyladenylate synthase
VPAASEIARAAALIREGRLVAFPTETVYGLGANALDEAAVRRIYEAKGRPPTSPLIVHVDSIRAARALVREWPAAAETLATQYWPGPLTLVLEKNPIVPDVVTAGLDTVGLRVPAHPLALELIRAAGTPIAAPSANRFSELSPTCAEHVRASLGAAVDLILDGGPAEVGIESTVLSLAGGAARLLRPGMVSREDVERWIGPVECGGAPETGKAHLSPGLHVRHYSPRTPLLLVDGGALPTGGHGAYVFSGEAAGLATAVWPAPMPSDPKAYASVLYGVLHALDQENLDWIAVERPPDAPEWAGILDRLLRATATRYSG